jgi:hypothetical protein
MHLTFFKKMDTCYFYKLGWRKFLQPYPFGGKLCPFINWVLRSKWEKNFIQKLNSSYLVNKIRVLLLHRISLSLAPFPCDRQLLAFTPIKSFPPPFIFRYFPPLLRILQNQKLSLFVYVPFNTTHRTRFRIFRHASALFFFKKKKKKS